jgi:Reverse transcriptase (RNA-dependent DNA polymerase)
MALYGLKISPLLWYKELISTLTEFGLKPVPGTNCLYTNGRLIVFFYVDDIAMLFAKKDLLRLEEFETKLLHRYEIRALGGLQWFLGIRIERDQANKKIWLCQDSYIEKIANRFNIQPERFPKSPLPAKKLVPSDQQTNPQRTLAYQQRVGSLAHLAVFKRPDIAKTHSKLAEFLVNPNQKHLDAANQAIAYCLRTKSTAIKYFGEVSRAHIYFRNPEGEDVTFYGASNAAFAN